MNTWSRMKNALNHIVCSFRTPSSQKHRRILNVHLHVDVEELRAQASGLKKNGEGCCAPLDGWSWVCIKYNVTWAKAYRRTKWHPDRPNRLATIDMGRKKLGRAAVPHLIQSHLGWGLAPYQVTSWSMQPFGCNRYGPKIRGGGCAPLGERQLGPHLTQCGQGQGLPAYQVASWSMKPFGHNTRVLQTTETTDRQTTSHDNNRTFNATVG